MKKKSFWDIFIGEKPKAYCRICNRPIFNLDTRFGMKKLCVYCDEAWIEGFEAGKTK